MAEIRIRNHEYGVLAGLEANQARYGYYLCPCRDGSGNRREDSDIICPCRYVDDDLAESGHCYCGLFVSGAFVERRGIIEPIPERRRTAEDHRGTDLYLTKRGIGRLSDLRDTGFTFSRLDALPAPEEESSR